MSFSTSVLSAYRLRLILLLLAMVATVVMLFLAQPLRSAIQNGWVVQPQLAAPAISTQLVPKVTLEQAQSQIPFHIPVFAWTPPGFVLGGAHVSPPDFVNIFYVPAESLAFTPDTGFGVSIWRAKSLSEQEIGGAQPQPDIFVSGHAAKYMAGPSVGSLTWEANGFFYSLTYSGLDLSREDLKRLAESLQ